MTTYEIAIFNDATLKGYRFCPDAPPRAILIIAHGMAETIERYQEFSEFLAQNDFCVYGHSHRGHGFSVSSASALGHLDTGGWGRMREELKAVILMARAEHPKCPIYLLGHSMGSFLVRDFLIEDSTLVDAVILSGTGFLPKSILNFATLTASMECRFQSPEHRSKLLTALSFGTYNKKIDHPETPFDWLSCDRDVVRAYIEDPLCGNVHTAGFYLEFFKNLKRILYGEAPRNLKSDLPILVLSGDSDPVGDYSRGVRQTDQYYASIGLNTTLKLYEGGRHEMLNAPERQEVYHDLLKWVQTHGPLSESFSV